MMKTSLFFLICSILLLFSVDEIQVEAKVCQIASVGCKDNNYCNQFCLIKYRGHGSCYRPPGIYLIECMCWYPC
ncbi:hypothetical protein FRX31_033198 [Thalictrum thalictroides]|uniref:Defensin-like protein n=1 Tax=Thalictrum thalictroides TaxID=46969 RepID=A0A7J6UX78_THATH|nr:hypothetical protein FRX31_033198 [Thalictrum thalictroides]